MAKLGRINKRQDLEEAIKTVATRQMAGKGAAALSLRSIARELSITALVNLLGRTNQPHTFTYIADFGKLLATLCTHENALGEVWFAPSNAPLTQAEFIGLIETELGEPVKTMVAGPLMMRFLGLFNKTMRETVEMMYEWQYPFFSRHWEDAESPWLAANADETGNYRDFDLVEE